MPFTFKYYGTNYTQVSICSNGWLAFGSTTSTNYTNTAIPNTALPNAAVYGLWDDLYPGYTGAPGDVYYYHDVVNRRFVVEWFRVARYGYSTTRETFEILLYNPAYYPTPTGDGEIVIQYLDSWDEADHTIGIENSAGTVGIQYYFDGAYHQWGVPVTSQFALKFTTWPPTVGVEEEGGLSLEAGKSGMVLGLNPFKGRLDIRYRIQDAGLGNQEVGIRVYDVSGRVVKTFNLVAGDRNQVSSVVWFGDDDLGRRLPAGVYFVKLEAGDFRQVEKAVLLR